MCSVLLIPVLAVWHNGSRTRCRHSVLLFPLLSLYGTTEAVHAAGTQCCLFLCSLYGTTEAGHAAGTQCCFFLCSLYCTTGAGQADLLSAAYSSACYMAQRKQDRLICSVLLIPLLACCLFLCLLYGTTEAGEADVLSAAYSSVCCMAKLKQDRLMCSVLLIPLLPVWHNWSRTRCRHSVLQRLYPLNQSITMEVEETGKHKQAHAEEGGMHIAVRKRTNIVSRTLAPLNAECLHMAASR
eukprot:1160138-Pelagomonas_calceolata.AAC.4